MKHNWIHKYFSEDDILTIQQEIAEVEKSTSGQMRLSIRDKRSLVEKLHKPHELAVKDFKKLGVGNTRHKTGILIFIIFSERFYDILADEGIHSKIPSSVWNGLETKLKEEFRYGNYLNGILHIIDKMGEILKLEYPKEADDTNELADNVVVN
jgi:uncharacterized membrane protein